jgi:hypothetical protein
VSSDNVGKERLDGVLLVGDRAGRAGHVVNLIKLQRIKNYERTCKAGP